MAGLCFDRGCCDRGYAYVGASRVRSSADLWVVDPVRRSDWLPVGEDSNGGEQLRRSDSSESLASEDDWGTNSEEEDTGSEEDYDSDGEPSTSMKWMACIDPINRNDDTSSLFM